MTKEVIWLSSVLLNKDDQRNYIGNTPVIVFFKDKGETFDISSGISLSPLFLPSLFLPLFKVPPPSFPHLNSSPLLEQIKKLGNLALVFFIVQPVATRRYR
jgi:hypothetical protein